MLSDIRKKNKHSTGSEILDCVCLCVCVCLDFMCCYTKLGVLCICFLCNKSVQFLQFDLILGLNEQKSKAKLKDALLLPLLISVQSSPGPLLTPDEWRRRGGGKGG